MKKTNFYCLLAVLCPYISRPAPGAGIQPLLPGDTVPAEVFSLLGYANSQSSTAVLIDFWEIGCGNCVATLPKLDSLQQQFPNQLQVITVCSNPDSNKIRRLLAKFPATRQVQLPLITGDSMLRQYFPYQLISHLVWIGPDRTVQAITGTAALSQASVADLVAGKALQLPLKNDLRDFDYEASLPGLAAAEGLTGFYNYISPAIPGIDAKTIVVHDTLTGITRVNFFNCTLLQLCRLALEYQRAAIPKKQLLLPAAKPGEFTWDERLSYTRWKQQHSYCVGMQVPLQTHTAKLHQLVQLQLSNLLQQMYGLRLEKKDSLLPCLLLQSMPGSQWQPPTGRGLYHNLSSLLADLNEKSELPWIYNETGIHPLQELDIDLPATAWQSATALAEALQPYGFRLQPAWRVKTIYQLHQDHFFTTQKTEQP